MSAEIELVKADESAEGARLDAFLSSYLAKYSRTRIQKAIEDGDILVNDRPSKPSYKVRNGDLIEVDVPDSVPAGLIPEDIPVEVVYEDHDLIVVNKPAGMVVHPGAGISSGTLANALVYHFRKLSAFGDSLRPGIVHRIDKETSGLLVVAKNDAAHQSLSDQFRDRRVFKLYQALVYGRTSESGEIKANIGRSHRNRLKMEVQKEGRGRSAHSIYKVLARYSKFSLLEVQIKTGRTHQIRVHLTSVGHPVVGDSLYGKGRETSVKDVEVRRRIERLGRQFLHASRLSFEHPSTKRTLDFEAPLPLELKEFLDRLK